MSLGILNNIAALYAENNLNTTQSNLQNTLNQLSSGSQINSGSDNPAGLAVADGLHANEAALTQSSQNATDGVGLLQTADGALSQVTNLLDSAVTLATEAANGTLTTGQISSANQEYQNILTQIGNIGSTTNFNSNNVFSANPESLFVSDGSSSGATTYSDVVGTLSIGSVGTTTGSLQSAVTAVASTSSTTAAPTVVASATSTASTATFTLGAATDQLSGTLTFAVGSSGTPASVNLGSTPLSLTATAAALNANTAFSSTNSLVATVSGASLIITGSVGASGADTISTTGSSLSTTVPGVVGHAAYTSAGAGVDFTAAGVSTLSSASAQTVLTSVTTAIADVAYQRGTIGADVNELTSASNVASSEEVNLTSAEDSIRSTNYGTAASDLSKYQILSQTGISALAQANSVQQEVLKLLQ
jgi:flagellin